MAINLIGKKYGRLTVIEKTNERLGRFKSHVVWLCKCDCGETCYITTSNLSYGNSKSCGCLRREVISEMRKKKNAG